jgi:hypothetical protein
MTGRSAFHYNLYYSLLSRSNQPELFQQLITGRPTRVGAPKPYSLRVPANDCNHVRTEAICSFPVFLPQLGQTKAKAGQVNQIT